MKKTIVTHNAKFHSDDVFAIATLLLLYPDAQVIRTRDEKIIESADLVVDVGGVYDRDKDRFDHHQPGGAGKRDNGIEYASFGLVWKEFGERLSGTRETAELIEEKLVMPIDAIDNGIDVSRPLFTSVREFTFADYLDSFASAVETLEDWDNVFKKIVPIAGELIMREIEIVKEQIADWNKVREIYEQSPDKNIIVLPEHLSWKKVLVPAEAVYVVSKRFDDRWQAQAVPKALGNFELKKPFPKSWGGQKGADLVRLSGVVGAEFCHRDCFLAVAGSKEGALELAKIALNA